MLSPIQLVTVSVADLDESTSFYAGAFGFREIARQTHEAGDPVLHSLWSSNGTLPDDLTAEVVVMESGDAQERNSTSGRLRLVQFKGAIRSRKIWEAPTRIQDLGHYAVNFRMHDLRRDWAGILEAGGTQKSEPTFWTVNEDVSVWDSQVWDPNGTILDIFEVQGTMEATLGPFDALATEVQTLAIHVADAKASHQFYKALGFGDVLYQATIENLESFFGVPEGTALININLMQKAVSPVGRIELAEYRGAGGARLDDVAVPPNLGPLAATFLVQDVEQALQRAVELGGTRRCNPIQCGLAPWGPVTAGMAAGLDGEALEFVSPVTG